MSIVFFNEFKIDIHFLHSSRTYRSIFMNTNYEMSPSVCRSGRVPFGTMIYFRFLFFFTSVATYDEIWISYAIDSFPNIYLSNNLMILVLL
jgi:hypothetical protein